MGTVTRAKRAAQPQAQATNDEKNFTNLWDLGSRWMVKVYVSTAQLRTLVGREVVGIAPHPQGGGRSVPVYDVDKTGWLDKSFTFFVPKKVNSDGSPKVYDLSARATEVDDDTDEVSVHIESTQVLVSRDEHGTYHISKMGYGEMVEHFGGTRLKRDANGALTEAQSIKDESF